MSEKYDCIMNKIAVTEEMKKRILINIQQEIKSSSPKIIQFNKKYLSLVSCCALIIIGALFVPV